MVSVILEDSIRGQVYNTNEIGLVKNPRIIADELSEKSGFDVYVPDILNGDPYPSSFMRLMPEVAGEKLSIGTRVSFTYSFD